MASSWGGAFGRAWGNAWGRITEVVETVTTLVGGGVVKKKKKKKKETQQPLPEFHPWIHSPLVKHYVETVEPEIVEVVIEVVAKAVEKRTVQDKDLETAKAEKEFRAYLAQQQAEWKEQYLQLILLEYERREQEYEDAQIAMLLFEM